MLNRGEQTILQLTGCGSAEPWMLLDFHAARAHSWLTQVCCPPAPSWAFQQSCSPARLYCCQGCFLIKSRIWHLSLNFRTFLLTLVYLAASEWCSPNYPVPPDWQWLKIIKLFSIRWKKNVISFIWVVATAWFEKWFRIQQIKALLWVLLFKSYQLD